MTYRSQEKNLKRNSRGGWMTHERNILMSEA